MTNENSQPLEGNEEKNDPSSQLEEQEPENSTDVTKGDDQETDLGLAGLSPQEVGRLVVEIAIPSKIKLSELGPDNHLG